MRDELWDDVRRGCVGKFGCKKTLEIYTVSLPLRSSHDLAFACITGQKPMLMDLYYPSPKDETCQRSQTRYATRCRSFFFAPLFENQKSFNIFYSKSLSLA